MKSIAVVAVLMMLAVPAWADEPQTNDPANSNEPIVLSEAEMDGVTAGDRRKAMLQDIAILTSSTTTGVATDGSWLVTGYDFRSE